MSSEQRYGPDCPSNPKKGTERATIILRNSPPPAFQLLEQITSYKPTYRYWSGVDMCIGDFALNESATDVNGVY